MCFSGNKRLAINGLSLSFIFFITSVPFEVDAQAPQFLIGKEAGISPNELQEIESTVSTCVGLSLQISESELLRRDSNLTVMFEQHEITENRNARYVAILNRTTPTDSWELGTIILNGQQTFSDSNSPTIFSGFINAEEADEIHEIVSEFWSDYANINDVQIDSINSSAGQLFENCSIAYPTPVTQINNYQVIVKSTPIDPPPPQRTESSDRVFTSNSSSDGEFSFWLRREDENSPITIKEIQCPAGNNCNPALLNQLQAGIINPTPTEIVEGRRLAILGALPDAYIYNQAVEYTHMLALKNELLIAFLREITISPNRQSSGSVNCQKQFDESDWRCNLNVFSIRQSLDDYEFSVTVSDQLITEEDVVSMVDLVVRELDASNGEINTMQIESQEDGYSARLYQSGMGPYLIRFDQSLVITSIE